MLAIGLIIIVIVGLEVVLYFRSGRLNFWDPFLLSVTFVIIVSNYTLSFNILIFEQEPQVFHVYPVWAVLLAWINLRKSDFSSDSPFKPSHIYAGLLWGLLAGLLSTVLLYGYYLQQDAPNISGNPLAITFMVLEIAQMAVAEEIICRKLLIGYLQRGRWSMAVSIIIQGVVFGFFHILKYPNYIPGIVFATLFGWLAGWLAVKQRNLWGVSVMHTVTNLTQVATKGS
jgi:membrane protease YdiL (CAAX protease family)